MNLPEMTSFFVLLLREKSNVYLHVNLGSISVKTCAELKPVAFSSTSVTSVGCGTVIVYRCQFGKLIPWYKQISDSNPYSGVDLRP